MSSVTEPNGSGVEPKFQIIREFAQHESWEPIQGVYLAYGIYPDVLTEELHGKSYKPPRLTNEQVHFLIQAENAIEASDLTAHPLPAEFIQWAEAYEFHFHAEWLRAAIPGDASKMIEARRDAFLIEKWALAPSWTLREGVALSLAIPPEFFQNDRSAGQLSDKLSQEVTRRGKFAKRAAERREISFAPTPREYLDWSTSVCMPFSAAWNASVESASNPPPSEPPETRSAELKTRERESLLKLVIGMAVRGYSYDPSAQRNEATKEIASDLDELGIGLADQPGYRAHIHYSDADYFNPSNHDRTLAQATDPRPSPSLEQVRHLLVVMPSETSIHLHNRALTAFPILTGDAMAPQSA